MPSRVTGRNDGRGISTTTPSLTGTPFHTSRRQDAVAAGPDVPIPSIEDGAPISPRDPDAVPTGSRSLSLSVVLTPPGTYPSSPDGSSPPRSSLGVENQLDTLALPSEGPAFDMARLTAAVGNVEAGDDSATALLDPDSWSPRASMGTPNRARGRRLRSQRNNTPHHVRDEEMPPEPFHEPAFQQAFADSKRVARSLADVLSGSSLIHEPDSTIRTIREKALQLSVFQPPSTRTIGFVGDSGVGKRCLFDFCVV